MQVNSHLSVLVFDQAKRYKEREAIVYKDFGGTEWKTYSWNDFAHYVSVVSNALLNLGVREQENVGIFSQNCAQYLFAEFGAWGVRAVAIPFYATCSEQQVQFMASDASVRVLFVGEQEQYDKARRAATLCHSLERIIVFDPNVAIDADDKLTMTFADFLQFGENLPRQTELEQLYKSASFDDTASILYTSGTSGDSKGVILTHAQYHAALEANDHAVPQLTDKDRVINFLPFAHIFEKGWTMLCLSQGATLIVNTRPQDIQQSLREVHPTCMCSVPRFWEKVYQGVMAKIDSANPIQKAVFRNALAVGRRHNIEYLSRGKRPPLALHLEYEVINKTIFPLVRKELGLENANIFPTAGATVSHHVEEFVHSIGIGMVVGYGLTESLATVSCDHIDGAFTVGSIGRPIDSIDVRISDEGEILLKGPTITKGYYKREDLTAAAFTSDGYFRTGDAGYIKDGELYLTDRIKDLYKTSNGKYIAPQMIESKLLVDKYVDQIAVIADQRKFVSALIVPNYHLLEEYAASRGIEYASREELCADSRIHEMLSDRMDTLQQLLAHYEQVKRFALLPQPFTMASGELTNTLKLKRRVIVERYKAVIDQMYEE